MSSPVELPSDLIGQSGLYNLPDPLLRRLRLEDTTGVSISDLEKYFRYKDLLIFYAGSEQGSNTDPTSAQRILTNQPWLRSTFHDNSDFAPLVPYREGARITELEEVSRGEDFIQAGEIEAGVEKIDFGTEENVQDYVRPLSRAATTVLMNVYSTPSIAVYHIPSHRFIAKNVRPSAFNSKNVDNNFRKWKEGGVSSIRITDILWGLKWPLFGLLLAFIYHLFIRFGGDEYNVLPQYLDDLTWRLRGGKVQT
ncbi:hypothetical protein TREMEDRAFT_69944 [Tremella mesenterica DSM 1558]|uniref:uncharacterized protein n=1 Tax=Tremella mesenterica (strain ATCC 24925 / CBS 8224 / DSM 1558 / NBRC 9311 / NRRL Y-6157 / RJB 2259-6 / UBC 559-6) TaxID=578456 RepID=UPI0003F4A021|nr:uncharacterized protein TREMEDRAFT_69944 [Tremella mesenterica DSM 1558]EIW67020.1 hypothetical protein TREMEDRAFT_69944 [Tremella mesenterica DSM 1558]